MSSKHIRGDVNYAWPSAQIAVMGAEVWNMEYGVCVVLYSQYQHDNDEYLSICQWVVTLLNLTCVIT